MSLPGRPVRVFASLLPFEAHMVASFLGSAGLDARVFGEHRAGLGGAVPFAESYVEVIVPQEEAEDALAALAAITEQGPDGQLSLIVEDDDTGRLSES